MERRPTDVDRLRAAKDTFRNRMLSSDAFFRLLQRRTTGQHLVSRDLPDFTCEPIFEPAEDGGNSIGLCLTYGMQSSEGGMSVGFSAFDNIRIGTLDATNELTFDPMFVQEIAHAHRTHPDSSETLEACAEVATTWGGAWSELCEATQDIATLNPISYTVGLRGDLDRLTF